MITFSQLGNLGRLGNSLFQCSTAIALALDNNDSYGFPSSWEYASHFKLDFCFFDKFDIKHVFNEQSFNYMPIQYKPNMDLRGYFQSEKYFINHKEMIIDLLTPKYDVNYEEGLCGLHVRRGDYLNLKDCYEQLDMNYYSKAMGIVGAKKYLIFSDDINWCKQNFIGKNFEFAEGNEPYVDLALMSKRCEHMIIANSSFSWWGAYLNKNTNKKVVAPSKWFGPKLPHDTKDLIPKEWHII